MSNLLVLGVVLFFEEQITVEPGMILKREGELAWV